MKTLTLTLLALATLLTSVALPWKPAGEKIRTPWAEKVDPASPLPEYPRPGMVREQWLCLNGLWDYAILPKGSAVPAAFDGRILVPFAVESSLSGVQKPVGTSNELWYSRSIDIPPAWKGKKILLNFGAVDRKVVKMDAEGIRKANQEICNSLKDNK